MRKPAEQGIALIEVLVGVAVASLVIGLIIYSVGLFFAGSKVAIERTQALYLAEEGIEILRYLRDDDWSTFDTDLTIGTTYYFDVTSAYVATTTSPEIIDSTYTRSFVLGAVERDGDDDITTSGTVDTGSKHVTVTVAWGAESVVLETILTNLHE